MSGPDFDFFAPYYDLEYADFTADVGLYLGYASRTGGPILEFGCGTGRLLLPLAQAGYTATGIDISEGMLARAHERLRARPDLAARVQLVRADGRDFAGGGRFALAFWAINSFMHLPTQADQLAALARAHAALRAGGLLLLDLFQPEPQALLEADGRLMHDFTWEGEEPGVRVLRLSSQRLDLSEQTLAVTYIYERSTPDGQVSRTVAPFTMRYLHRFEVELLLERAGFVVEARYGGYDLEELDAQSPRLIFVARKGA